jgi:hypothetical protein
LEYGGIAVQFCFSTAPETRMGPKRAASTGSMPIRTRSASVATNSRGQTQEQLEAEEQSRISHDLENTQNDDHHNDIDVGRDNESDDDQTLDDLLAAAQASNAAARLVASRKILLKKGMNILHSQGENITLNCDEILALNLTESEIKTRMRQYALQPQKVSLPGPSAT